MSKISKTAPVNENVEWIKRRKEFLKNIKSFEPKGDRIQVTTQLSYIHNAIHESILGWANWINGWISIELTKKIKIDDPNSVQLTDTELKELHEKFKEFALKFVELDVKYTELITKKLAKKKISLPAQQFVENTYKGIVV